MTDVDRPLRYFAYGSNMSLPRLTARVGAVRVLGVASLAGHRLAFHKRGRDGSAKCDIPPAPGERVWGVLFELAGAARAVLDRYEGVGAGYDAAEVQARLADDRLLTALSYRATDIAPDLLPYDWYRDHVLHGARQHGLPAAHLALIRAVPVVADPDPERARRERAVYD